MMTTQETMGAGRSARRTEGDRARRADLMSAAAGITIGVREYHAATGEYMTVREPTEYGDAQADSGFLSNPVRFPPCQCASPACPERAER